MRIYLIQKKGSTQRPRILIAPDGKASTACEMAGLTPETAHCKDITRRTLQPLAIIEDRSEAEQQAERALITATPRVCRGCGCTDERACRPNGCYWAEWDRCNVCWESGRG